MRVSLSLLATILVLGATFAQAQVPRTLSYQGVLTDTLGHPRPDGTYSFTFRLYATSSGGTAIWSETKTLSVSQGLFSTVLGDQVPNNLPFDAPYWLSIQIASDPELSPRIPLTSVGYSLHALKADTALYAKGVSQTGQVVRSLNNLKDSVTLAAGSNITITPSGNTLTIAAGSGLTLPYSTTASSANTLLSITNTGAGSAASFTIANGADTNAALRASTNGMGSAIYGSSLQADGVYGETHYAGQMTTTAGVRGTATGTSGAAMGVWGDASANPGGSGVYGIGGQTGGLFSGGTFGVFGVSYTGMGAAGVTNATHQGATGVYGNASPSTGQIIGVRGAALNSPEGTGVQGEGRQRGVAGLSYEPYGIGVYAYTSKEYGIGLSARADGTNGKGIYAFADNGGDSYAINAQSFNGYALIVNGKFYQNDGSFEAHPSSTIWSTNKPATVKLNDGTKVKLFAEEAAELFFNDYGESALQNGRAHVELDARFLQTVTIDPSHPMKVFVQLEGDCKGVYVTNKTVTGFDVVELQGGTSNAQFTYRVACKRKYYEDERLATEEEDLQFNRNMLEKVWPEVIARQRTERTRALEYNKQVATKALPVPTLPGEKR